MSPSLPLAVRAAPHYGEEPCISGTRGSGAIFFSGCNLKCVFCQNIEISRIPKGKKLSVTGLKDTMKKLEDQGVHNINLVTPSHYIRAIAKALSEISLSIPVIWNSSGYDKVESLKMLDGLIDIYMPDFKYASSGLASALSGAVNYASTAKTAISEMFRQTGRYELDENGIMKKGVLIRHLMLPGQSENTMDAIDFAADEFGDNVLFSLMSQYTPIGNVSGELKRKITPEENADMIHYMKARKLVGFTQDTDSSCKDFIPDFDLTGL